MKTPSQRERFNALLDAAQATERDLDRWAREVLARAEFLLEQGCGYGLHVVRRSADGSHVVDVFHGCGVLRDDMMRGLFEEFVGEQNGDEMFESVWETRRPVLKLSTVLPVPTPAVQRICEHTGASDSLAVLASAGVGRYFSLFSYLPKVHEINPQHRAMLSSIRPVLETALRLRVDASLTPVAILSDTANLLHLDATSGLRPFVPDLKRHIARLERVRSGCDQVDLPAGAWDKLCDGRWLLMQCEGSDGRKHYVAFEGQPPAVSWHQITVADRKIVEYFLEGLNGKEVGARMKVSEAQVSTRLAKTARALGLRTRSELLRVIAMLRPGAHRRARYHKLTHAEQQVLSQLELGMSNEQIAAHRGRSPKTIANQVASILRKTASRSRRAAISANR